MNGPFDEKTKAAAELLARRQARTSLTDYVKYLVSGSSRPRITG